MIWSLVRWSAHDDGRDRGTGVHGAEDGAGRHRWRIFPWLREPIFTQAMSRTRTPKNFAKNTIFMPQFWPGDVKLNIMRSPDPEILVFL